MRHTGYTPGPWTIQPNGSVYIGRPHWEHGACYVNAANPADNTLIADAPRLAEENERLRALLKDLMVECSQHIPEDSNCERLKVVCGQVRAALTGGCSCGQTDSNHTNDGCNLNRAALSGREEGK